MMNKEVIILIAEDEEGHALLIKKNLKRAGLSNDIVHFKNGQEILDYLYCKGEGPHREIGKSYLMLLDIRMPKVNGVEVLRQIKRDPQFRSIPTIMITTTDDPREIEKCHDYGCSSYITKPVDYEKFVEAIRQLGLFLMVVEIPALMERKNES